MFEVSTKLNDHIEFDEVIAWLERFEAFASSNLGDLSCLLLLNGHFPIAEVRKRCQKLRRGWKVFPVIGGRTRELYQCPNNIFKAHEALGMAAYGFLDIIFINKDRILDVLELYDNKQLKNLMPKMHRSHIVNLLKSNDRFVQVSTWTECSRENGKDMTYLITQHSLNIYNFPEP